MTDTVPLREQIARLIDPHSWGLYPEDHPEIGADEGRRGRAKVRAPSLATADAIMALLPSLPDGWVAAPLEPTEEIIEAMYAGYRSTRRYWVSGQSLDARWHAEYGPEIAAYRALVAACPAAPPPDGRVGPTYEDACRLSRAFNQSANLRDDQDRRINEWIKTLIQQSQIAALSTQAVGD